MEKCQQCGDGLIKGPGVIFCGGCYMYSLDDSSRRKVLAMVAECYMAGYIAGVEDAMSKLDAIAKAASRTISMEQN